MIYTYNECIELFGSHYALSKAIESEKIYKIKNGIYSDIKKPKDLEIFIKEHKDAVFTMESALYYLNISDVVPHKYYVATDKDASKYNNQKVKQYFLNNGLHKIGVTTLVYSNIEMKIFNKERMLIEVIRNKKNIPFDYYKDIINYYRMHINDIDMSLVLDYLELFPKKNLIMKIIQLEVL